MINNVPTSSFYRLVVIITFQHVNRTFNVIFDSFKSHGLTNASINNVPQHYYLLDTLVLL